MSPALRSRLVHRLMLVVAALLASAGSAGAVVPSISPEIEKQEQEIERLLRRAESEFWSLKQRIDQERTERQQRLDRAKADYEQAQRTVEATEGSAGSAARERAAYQADRALETYHTELERAMQGVDSARTELDRIEQRVSRYRATLEALRRRTRGTPQSPESAPAVRDSSSAREPVTAAQAADRPRRS
ncbi:MAG TPA: hypothetical protein VNA88_15485 [Candidatus Kapabacteria bacterium]|nr:hypothetical protein [Candidatus Kapabacteria bacterium]